MRGLALTIDLDSPSEYARLHGLVLPHEDPLLMYRGPLARFTRLCEAIGIPGTIFSITRDVVGMAAEKLRDLGRAGYEVASHSHNHDYGLARRSGAAIDAELSASISALEQRVGVRPLGFRAPGYLVSPALLDALARHGFGYDSSVLPSPPYYVAKLAVLGAYRLTGRASASVIGPWAAVRAPRQPYRPGADPYAPGDRSLCELPIAVAGVLRLPITGASLVLAPARVRAYLANALSRLDVVVLNLHGMDLVDPTLDSLPASLAERQPELRRPIAAREALLRDFVQALAAGRTLATCAELAARCAPIAKDGAPPL